MPDRLLSFGNAETSVTAHTLEVLRSFSNLSEESNLTGALTQRRLQHRPPHHRPQHHRHHLRGLPA